MSGFTEYLKGRLSEPSTWRGITAMLTAAGVALSPEQIELFVSAGVGVIGLIGAFVPDAPDLSIDLKLDEMDEMDGPSSV